MWGVAGLAALAVLLPAWLFRARAFLPDPLVDAKTRVAPSRIPGAGDGLFAAAAIKRGERVAELGGELVFEARIPRADRGYIFAAPACAKADLWPFDALDARRVGGRGSKINFAPRQLNGADTGFQNARGREMCQRPYIYFEATRDIAEGEEILTSYGPDYDYAFMDFPDVRAHFCKEAGADCSERYGWKP